MLADNEQWLADNHDNLALNLDRIGCAGSRPRYTHPKGNHMAQGIVKWFNSQKGFGFIQPDVAARMSSCTSARSMQGLNEGQKTLLLIERLASPRRIICAPSDRQREEPSPTVRPARSPRGIGQGPAGPESLDGAVRPMGFKFFG
jgi:cold shock CspA family protein